MNGNSICQSLSFKLHTPDFHCYYWFPGSKHRKKNLLVSIRVYWFVENTPWYTQHFLSHSLILFYSISAFCYMATPPNTHQHEKHPHIPETTPTINHSLLWSISSSYKSAVLTLPNTKSSDAISTYGTQRTHTQHFPRFISCMWGKIHQFYPG